MSIRADYHANLFKFIEGAVSDLHHAAASWDTLGYFDQTDVLDGVQRDASISLASLERELHDGHLPREYAARLAALREKMNEAINLSRELEAKLKPTPTREEYEALVASQQEPGEAA